MGRSGLKLRLEESWNRNQEFEELQSNMIQNTVAVKIHTYTMKGWILPWKTVLKLIQYIENGLQKG